MTHRRYALRVRVTFVRKYLHKTTLTGIFRFLRIGAALKGKNLLPWEQILPFKRSPYFRSDSRHTFQDFFLGVCINIYVLVTPL